MRRRIIGCCIALTLGGAVSISAAAQTPPEGALSAAVDGAVSIMIVPAYKAFAGAAATEKQTLIALCAAPSKAGLARARTGFTAAALAFSHIEPFRFGPARTNNRFERLFFWPDKRGRGFRQITRLLREENAGARKATTLEAKSVAIQGLPALEYVLFGKGSDSLATAPAGFRCDYATALGERISIVATALHEDWTGPYGADIRAPSDASAEFRTSAEAIQALLRSAREQLQVVSAFKLNRVLGGDKAPPKPRTAPFANAQLAIPTTLQNIAAIEALIKTMRLSQALPPEKAALENEIAFQLKNARTALMDAQKLGGDWPGVLASPKAKDRAKFAALSVSYAIEILEDRLPQALGLIPGFNALDGD